MTDVHAITTDVHVHVHVYEHVLVNGIDRASVAPAPPRSVAQARRLQVPGSSRS